MCLIDYQLGRLIRTEVQRVTIGALSNQIFRSDQQRVAILFLPDETNTYEITFNTQLPNDSNYQLTVGRDPWLIHMKDYGDLPTREFVVNAGFGNVDFTLMFMTLPEKVLAALPPAPGMS